MNIPEHLKHLPVDRVGRPVPYINIWGKETPERWTIAFDRIIRRRAAFFDDDLDGEPDFTKQAIQRQRQCMLYGVCQVCTRPVDWALRRLVVSAISVEKILVREVPVYTVTEPWLCPDCSEFAVRYCPGLIRRSRADDLTIVDRITEDGTTPIISEGWIEGPYEETTKRYPVAMWVKLMLTDVRITAGR